MTEILIIAGDRGRVRLFSLAKGEEQMRELSDMVNPTLRVHERELSGDRQGRGISRQRGSHTALGEPHPHKRVSSMRFARQVAEAVQALYTQRDYLRIFLLADPEFVGLMRPQLAAKNLSSALQVIPKSVTRSAPAEIRAQLPEHPWRPTSDGTGV